MVRCAAAACALAALFPPRVSSAEGLWGRVSDPSGAPLAGAAAACAGEEAKTDERGWFTLTTTSPCPRLTVKMGGRTTVRISPEELPVEVVLAPARVEAAYLSYWGVIDAAVRNRVLGLVRETELDAVVIDVKGDAGFVPYASEVALAKEVGATRQATFKGFDRLLADLRAEGVYTIARIVVFKDDLLARHRPEWAVIDTRTGEPWRDRERLAWIDPSVEAAWSYSIDLAREAAAKGFDEIQLDYVRFPTDGAISAARYAVTNDERHRVRAITDYVARVRAAVGPLGALLAVDVFGYTAFNQDDTGIGQRVEELAPFADVLCPMAYPSAYHLGLPGKPNPVRVPYDVAHDTVRKLRERTKGLPVTVRPWLQDFRDYAFDRRAFGPDEVRAQIDGAIAAEATGWMLWNPRNEYTRAALER